jgi:hypothetical protein
LKGLEAACAAKAAVNLGLTETTDKALVYSSEQDKEMSEAIEVVVYKALRKPQHIYL